MRCSIHTDLVAVAGPYYRSLQDLLNKAAHAFAGVGKVATEAEKNGLYGRFRCECCCLWQAFLAAPPAATKSWVATEEKQMSSDHLADQQRQKQRLFLLLQQLQQQRQQAPPSRNVAQLQDPQRPQQQPQGQPEQTLQQLLQRFFSTLDCWGTCSRKTTPAESPDQPPQEAQQPATAADRPIATLCNLIDAGRPATPIKATLHRYAAAVASFAVTSPSTITRWRGTGLGYPHCKTLGLERTQIRGSLRTHRSSRISCAACSEGWFTCWWRNCASNNTQNI